MRASLTNTVSSFDQSHFQPLPNPPSFFPPHPSYLDGFYFVNNPLSLISVPSVCMSVGHSLMVNILKTTSLEGKKTPTMTLPPTTANNCHSTSAKSPLHPCWDVGCLGNLGCCGPAVSRGHPIHSTSPWPLVLTMDPSIPKSGATVCISTLRSRTPL